MMIPALTNSVIADSFSSCHDGHSVSAERFQSSTHQCSSSCFAPRTFSRDSEEEQHTDASLFDDERTSNELEENP